MEKVSEVIRSFLEYLRGCVEQSHICEAVWDEKDKETQDLLHCFELGGHGYHERARLGAELTRARLERRAAKDEATVLRLVEGWVKENQPMVKSLERLLGEVRKCESKLENRTYVPRVRGDLFGKEER